MVQINCIENPITLNVQNQLLDKRSLRKMNLQHCKITYRYELDSEIDKAKSSVESVT